MKIAIITSGFLPVLDGVTITGYARLKELSRLGHQVKLFCPDYSKIASIYPHWQDYTGNILPGVEIINLPSTAFFVEFERNVAWYSYGLLQQKLEEFEPDIIHVDEPERLYVGFWRVPGLKYAKKHGIPCVGFFRTNFIEYLEDFFPLPQPLILSLQWLVRKLVLKVYNAYDVTLVTSKVTAKKIAKMGIKNTQYDNFLGINIDTFEKLVPQDDFFAKEYDLPQLDNKVKLVFLGRLTPEKGWNFTLSVLPQLAEELHCHRIAVLVVGDGELKTQIAQEMKQYLPHFHLFGRVEPHRVAEILVNSDVHVTTSEKETRGLTVLEAFTAGIPVLAPDSEGVTENIESGVNGYLYEPGNSQDFLNKLKTLVEEDQQRTKMGIAGQTSIASKYSWEVAIANLLKVWQSQIDRQAT